MDDRDGIGRHGFAKRNDHAHFKWRVERAQKFGRSSGHQVTRLPGANHLLIYEGAADAAIEATANRLRSTETARTQ